MPPLDLSLYRQDEGRQSESNSPCPIPAPEPALGSHPCGALSSAQVALVYVKKSNPAKPKTVNHVSGTKCKRCAGLDTSSSACSMTLQFPGRQYQGSTTVSALPAYKALNSSLNVP